MQLLVGVLYCQGQGGESSREGAVGKQAGCTPSHCSGMPTAGMPAVPVVVDKAAEVVAAADVHAAA